MHVRWLGGFVGVVIGVGAVGWVARPTPAAAVDPPVLAAFRARLAAAERLYLYLWLPDAVSGAERTAMVQADLPARRLAFQISSHTRFVYQDGVLTMSSATLGGPTGSPIRLAAFEPYFAWLLSELDSGFASATFTAEVPPNESPGGSPTGVGWGVWRVSFPGPLDDPYRIYLDLQDPGHGDAGESCRISQIHVFPVGSAEPSTFFLPTLPFASSRDQSYGWSPLTRSPIDLCSRLQWDPVWSESVNGLPDPWSSRMYLTGYGSDEYGGLAPDLNDNSY